MQGFDSIMVAVSKNAADLKLTKLLAQNFATLILEIAGRFLENLLCLEFVQKCVSKNRTDL